MSEDLGVLLLKANSEKDELHVTDDNSIFKKFNFPLKSNEELEELEEFLLEDLNFKTFVCTCTVLQIFYCKFYLLFMVCKILFIL